MKNYEAGYQLKCNDDHFVTGSLVCLLGVIVLFFIYLFIFLGGGARRLLGSYLK